MKSAEFIGLHLRCAAAYMQRIYWLHKLAMAKRQCIKQQQRALRQLRAHERLMSYYEEYAFYRKAQELRGTMIAYAQQVGVEYEFGKVTTSPLRRFWDRLIWKL